MLKVTVENVVHSDKCISSKLRNSSITVLFCLAMDRCGLDAISTGSESQDLHAVIRILLETVQNGFAGRRNLGVLRVLVVPCVGRSVDDLK